MKSVRNWLHHHGIAVEDESSVSERMTCLRLRLPDGSRLHLLLALDLLAQRPAEAVGFIEFLVAKSMSAAAA
jgi:hypothetical protein